MRLKISWSIMEICAAMASKVNPSAPTLMKSSESAMMKAKSPTRFNMNALFAAVILSES